MQTIYELGPYNIWTGISREITNKQGRPPNWIRTTLAPPEGFAQWNGDRWVVLDEYPVQVNTWVQTQLNIISQTQQRLDVFAQSRGYDNILSLCTYAGDSNTVFDEEAQYGKVVRSATWTKLYEILTEVNAGTRPEPSGYVDIMEELPVLTWPSVPV